MKKPLGILAVTGLLLVGGAAAGCGPGDVIDAAKTEIAVRYDVEEATGAKVGSVACPADVPASPGTRFTCRVETEDGDVALAELEVRTTRGDLRVIRLRKP